MIKDNGNSGFLNYILLIAAGLLGFMLINLIHTHYSFEAVILVTILFVLTAQLFLHQMRRKDLFRQLFYKEKETREHLEEYKTILYNIGEAVLTTDFEGKVNRMNTIAEKLTEWKAADAVGIKIETILKIAVGEDHAELCNLIGMIMQTDDNQIIPAGSMLVTLSGNRIPVTGSASKIKGETGEITGVIFILLDQTEEMIAHNLLKSRLSLLEYHHRSTNDILQKSIDEISKLTGSAIGFYHFVEKDQVNLSLQAWSTRTLNEFCIAEGKGMHYNLDKAGVWADCVRTGAPVIHNNYDTLPNKKGMPQGHAVLKRELVVPVKKDGLIVAIIGVGNKADDYNESDVAIVSFLGDVTWELVSRKIIENEIVISEESLARAEIISGTGNWKINIKTGDVSASEGARKIYGFHSQMVTYENIKSIPLAEYRSLLDEAMNNLVHRESPYDVEFEIIAPDTGERKCIHSLASYDSMNSVVFGVLQDITHRKKDEQTLRSLNNQLKELNATKDKLFSIIAHDLKSPFSGVIGLTEILCMNFGTFPPEKVKMYLEEILSTTKNSLIFLDNLLVWAKAQTGQMEFNPDALDLATMLNEVSGIFNSQLQLKKLTVAYSGCTGARIFADRNMFQAVLRNLFSNAIKFTPEKGHIELNFRSDNDAAILTLRDNGIGMSKDAMEKLFRERYLSSPGTNGEKGSGLGLLICREFVQRHGGELTVSSVQGKGTEFVFSLPYKK
jgi:PAS domain S-box-containing protein